MPASLPRVILATLLYVAAAGAADYALGTNYGFLRGKGDHVSLLTWLAPWPWYIGELVADRVALACRLLRAVFCFGRAQETENIDIVTDAVAQHKSAQPALRRETQQAQQPLGRQVGGMDPGLQPLQLELAERMARSRRPSPRARNRWPH